MVTLARLQAQEASLVQAAVRLRDQGGVVSIRLLANVTDLPTYLVLYTHWDLFPAETCARQHQCNLEQVAQVYAQLVALAGRAHPRRRWHEQPTYGLTLRHHF